ncbi:YraN family protein [Pseudoalteromonas sp. C2R02]|uniref:YraN family protein n=1 Tax=Pseudoalteromonas sp. C2R02 TaxID=2841565 RepID=UPI001C086519|nr:YraN family protein [Pseudoalteromonas sp. C2R02]MBU2972018.1 YraN family protein [Pseudoalteromonas sp. C2R02]
MLDNESNYFDRLYARVRTDNSVENAFLSAIEAYLEGKPNKGKKKPNQISNHVQFWKAEFLKLANDKVFESEAFILALAIYFKQTTTSNIAFIERVLIESPASVRKAIRRSEIVLIPNHIKWDEINLLSQSYSAELSELINICQAFQNSHVQRIELLNSYLSIFKDLSLFEFFAYSAVYSFKFLPAKAISFDGDEISIDSQLKAMTKLTQWKLENGKESDFTLNENKILQSLKKHHSPLVFPSNEDSSLPDFMLHQFECLVQAQVELDEFLSRSVHPFCFKDSVKYEVKGTRLESVNSDCATDDTWERNGLRNKQLQGYWFNRAMNHFVESGIAAQQMGTAENHEANQIAYVKALASFLELKDVYGLEDTLECDSGLYVDLFQALLSQELMSAFYIKEYIEAFYIEYAEVNDWQHAIGLAAIKGMAKGDNRMPITWSKWKAKVNNIVGWTVNAEFPKGNVRAVKAILDFWTLDLKSLSNKLKSKTIHRIPEMTERPVIKIGDYAVQLPWVMASQIGSVSAINNLRRFANQRPSLKSETTRIENRLGDEFTKRGFTVVKNHTPNTVAGEIDLICSIDNVVIVIEVKSTYYRTTPGEALYHRNQTLRKAGKQVHRKVEAIKNELANGGSLLQELKLKSDSPQVIGWIADTSIEYDHDYFAGYLKISIEELLVALNDEAYLLKDLDAEMQSMQRGGEISFSEEPFTLYEKGFSGQNFVNVIEQSKVWHQSTAKNFKETEAFS